MRALSVPGVGGADPTSHVGCAALSQVLEARSCSRRPQQKNESTFACGPCTLKKGHYSIPVEWLNLIELTDEHAIFEVWPTEQDRIAATHLMDMPDLTCEKVEEGVFHMPREQYDLCNAQY